MATRFISPQKSLFADVSVRLVFFFGGRLFLMDTAVGLVIVDTQ
jgi:hypothetical protein